MPIGDEHALEIVKLLGKLDERTENIEKVLLGNGQPGLTQKVEDLTASKNRLWGFGWAVTFLYGIAEYLMHRKN